MMTQMFSKSFRQFLMPLRMLNLSSGLDIQYIVEPRNWSIRDDGFQISREVNRLNQGYRMAITDKPFLASAPIVHFGSQFMFQNWANLFPKKTKIIVTYFHGKFGDGPLIEKNLSFLIENQDRVDSVVVSFSLMKKRLIESGLNPRLLKQIPIGVSTTIFEPPRSKQQIASIRKSLGIPSSHFVIGSFQKDGEGWREGLTPKLIKGPDIFVDTVRELSRKLPIFILLSGPSRGFVMKELDFYKIPYSHFYAQSSTEMVKLYQALDLYLITSREEGGPKGLIESLSVGCPVVTTPVGMATDMLMDGRSSSVSLGFEPQQIAGECLNVLLSTSKQLSREELRNKVLSFDWKNIAKLHLNQVYETLT